MRPRLHLAARDGELTKVEQLLKTNKELLNTKDHHGNTPLHYAARCGHLDIVTLLLSKEDIEYDAKNNDGMTPLHEASRCERWDSINDGYGHPDIVKILLEKGANPDEKNQHGYTPLHVFAHGLGIREKIDIIKLGKFLLNSVSNINEKDHEGETPLHKASGYFGKAKIAKLLLDHGADYKILNKKNKSPLDLAQDYNQHEIIQLILISQRNKYGKFFSPVSTQQIQQIYEKLGYETNSVLKK